MITFVTVYTDIYKNPSKTIEWRFSKFKDIALTGINICLYVDKHNYEYTLEFVKDFENIKVMDIFDLKNMHVYKQCEEISDITLPSNINESKDTKEYMILMNSKVEIMKDVIDKNPWNTEYFAWIDFSISYIFKDLKNTQNCIREMYKITDKLGDNVFIPGCWNKIHNNESMLNYLLNNIYWRFCGGFVIGNKKSITEFDDMYKKHFANFLNEHKRIVWEVNFWTWLETYTEWKPVFYLADHNDTIVQNLSKIFE